MNYHILGRLPLDVISFFREQVLKTKVEDKPFQWLRFNEELHLEFLKIFENRELQIQKNTIDQVKIPIQKVFYSEPGYGFKIHKDGLYCKSALNIALQANDSDWIRWYDEDYINSLGKLKVLDLPEKKSRNVEIDDYEKIDFIDSLQVKTGDVYVVNTDVYHSFKCNGPKIRLVLQTKFDGYPSIEKIVPSLSKTSFVGIEKYE